MTELQLFIIVGGLAVVAAVGMLLSENAVHSALFLILNFICVAFLYLLLDAPFLSMVQIAVYAGAIMVLFLFVIMLLGAEKTTDTTPRFRWLTGAVLLLAGAMLLIIGLPLVAGEFSLPDPPGDTPLVRFMHAATDLPAMDVAVDGEVVASDITFGGTAEFGELQFMELLPGEYTATFSDMETGDVVQEVEFALEPNEVQTVIVFGEGEDVDVAVIADDLSTVEERSSRLTVFNAASAEPLTLVNLGENDDLDTESEDVVDAEGNTLTNLVIDDEVLVVGVAYGSASEAVVVDEGLYTLSFVSPIGQEIETLSEVYEGDEESVAEIIQLFIAENFSRFRDVSEFEVQRDTAQLLVLTAERLDDGSLRPTVVDGDGDDVIDGQDIAAAASFGGPQAIGQVLFTDYLLPFQMVAILLLVAMIGALILTRGSEPYVRRLPVRHRVSRPLADVISSQVGRDVHGETETES